MKIGRAKIILLFVLILFAGFVCVGCGSSSGFDSGQGDGDGDGDGNGDPTQPTYNFTGSVYGENGAPVSDVLVYVFSDFITSTTNPNGQFAFNVAEELHTVLSSRSGYIDQYELVDLSSGSVLEEFIMLGESLAPVMNIFSTTGGTVLSNIIEGGRARLEIPPQSGGFGDGFQPGTDNANLVMDLVNLSDPLPVPMPSPNTLQPGDTIIGGKQSPIAMVSIKPPLLEMTTPATLILPNKQEGVGKRILKFDPNQHGWVPTGAVADETPEDGTAVSISKGGVYGIFYEEARVGTINGTATPGTFVIAGDEVVEVLTDGTFHLGEVTIPPDGIVTLVSIDPETGRVMEREVNLLPGEVVSIDISQIIIGTVTVTAGSDTLVANGEASVAITAEVLDTDGLPAPDGTLVSFSTTAGTLSENTVKTVSGLARVELTSSTSLGVATINASAGGVTESTTVEFIPAPSKLALSASQPSVKTDNSDSSVITATVLNNNNAPYVGATVTFSSTGGQLNTFSEDGNIPEDPDNDPSTVITGPDGTAKIRFSSGNVDRVNQIVTVTADVEGILQKAIPVLVTGTTVTLETQSPILEIGGENRSTLSILVEDAGGNPIFDAPIEMEGEPTGVLTWELDPDYTEYRTDVNGRLLAIVSGVTPAEEAMLTVSSLGATATQSYKVGSLAETFSIVSPENDPFASDTGVDLPIVVRAVNQQRVRFATSFGTWENGGKVIEKDVPPDGMASAVLNSPQAGLATVQAFDASDPTVTDTARVAFSASVSQARKIALQASATVVAPSTGDVSNTVTLTATVRTEDDQVVKGAPVVFSMEQTTGGGESISPVIVFTDSFGVANSTFTSGSLSSDASGVKVIATVLDTPIEDSIRIIIGGTAGSILIGRSTEILSSETNTEYILPMSVLVTDSNGNPVSGTRVTLNAWPLKYATGFWTAPPTCNAVITGIFDNEDKNRNLVLDPGEDSEPDGNEDGRLTPSSSSAGAAVPSIVTTDENGVANFDLIYLKNAAVWIETEITATTLVHGSETQASYNFGLPFLEEDACFLPHSPYNEEQDATNISLSAEPDELIADGSSQSTITAELTDINMNPAGEGIEVSFFTTEGTLSSATATTDEDGIATVTLTSTTFPAEAVVTARTEDDISAEVSVSFIAGEPAEADVTVIPSQLFPDGESTSEVTASVYDSQGNTVADGTFVTFDLTGPGSIFPRKVPTQGGNAQITYTAGDTPGTATIRVTGPDGQQLGQTTITISNILIELSANPSTLEADGSSESVIEFLVTDQNGQPYTAGGTLTFSATHGTFSQRVVTIGGNGTGSVTYIAPFSEQNLVDTITADGPEGSRGTVQIDLTATDIASPATIEVADNYPSPGTIRIQGSAGETSSEFVFNVFDTNGDPVRAGFEIQFSIVGDSLGASISPTTATTDDSGQVRTELTSGTVPGTVTVQALYQLTGASGSASVTIGAGLPVGEGFTINAPSQVTVGSDSTISITARDYYGFLVPDGTSIAFKTYGTGGTLFPSVEETGAPGVNSDPTGVATSTLSVTSIPPDGILSVTAETDEGHVSTHVTSLALIPSDFNARDNYVIYAGTNGGGVYRSTNSGDSWQNVTRSLSFPGQNWVLPYVNDVAIDRDDPNTVYAATGFSNQGNVYRSLDQGSNWSSNMPGEWNGLKLLSVPVAAVLCDYDDNDTPLPSNASPWAWMGTEGNGLYYADDGVNFQQSNGLGNGAYVMDIVRVEMSHGSSAVLYAGTATGIYKSTDGGQNWSETDTFSGDSVVTLALHPSSIISFSDVIYAGTENAGVWISLDSGTSWQQVTTEGMGSPGVISDLLVDEDNNYLYAATHKAGGTHEVGSVFGIELNPDGSGSIDPGAFWKETNTNLPQYDPPDDTSLFAVYALAHEVDFFGNTTTLYVGGEGINLMKAQSGLAAGDPQWASSSSGMTNTIMARTVVRVEP